MKKTILTLAMVALTLGAAVAQEPEVTEECRKNASLFTSYSKAKDYASALEFWESVYRDCPNATKNIYNHGPRIIEWQMSQTQDPKEQQALFDKLMGLYDNWVKYFGKDEMTCASIMLKKAYTYSQHRPDDKATPYKLYKDNIHILGNATDAGYLQSFMLLSEDLYRADNSLAEQYLADYTAASAILAHNAADSTVKNFAIYGQVKAVVDQRFAASGVADCDKMNSIFLPEVQANKDNAEFLTNIMKLFKQLDCKEIEAYYEASKYSYQISPSAEAASGLGRMMYAQKNNEEAIKYFKDCLKLNDDKADNADAYLMLALCYDRMDNNSLVKEYSKRSLELNPNQSIPHILIAKVYAAANVNADDPVLARAKYWAAVDQLLKARNVETKASVLETINKLISTYSAMYPTKEQVFMHNEISEGKSYFVGGIVGETTTVRAK